MTDHFIIFFLTLHTVVGLLSSSLLQGLVSSVHLFSTSIVSCFFFPSPRHASDDPDTALIFFLLSYFSICNPVIFLWLYLLLLQSCFLSYSCISFIGGLVLFLTSVFPLSAVLSSFLTAVSSYVLLFFFL